MNTENRIFSISNLSFSYGREPTVDLLNLDLACGEVVSILGPNGSGKSTLLKLLLGDLHGSGQINWEEQPINNWSRRKLSRVVAYLPQNPSSEDGQTVQETLALGRSPYWGAFGLESAEDWRVVNSVIEQLEIGGELLGRRLDEISGGQRQRIFIGRCLIQEPRALLLDEPTNNLDLRYQMQVLSLLRRLAHEKNLAILMTAHDLNLAAEFSDRMVLLKGGRKLAEGAPAEILQAELLQELYGIPMEILPRPGRTPVVFPSGA